MHHLAMCLEPVAQKVVRSTELAGRKLTLIGFASPKDASAEDNSLVGHLLIETSPGRYEHVKFPSCQEEGGAPDSWGRPIADIGYEVIDSRHCERKTGKHLSGRDIGPRLREEVAGCPAHRT